MTMHENTEDFDFGGPAPSQIVVQGTVGESWRSRLGGMAITTASERSGVPHTSLRGWIRDQAALHGLFRTLYALHLPILKVTKEESSAG